MANILILYFSGVGVTKKIAELMKRHLSKNHTIELHSIEEHFDCNINLNCYDALIIGTPVYHAAPAKTLIDYFNIIDPLTKTTPAFIYNTRALYSCNTNRILAKQIKRKNIITVMDRKYRGPATDGTLLLPFVRRFWKYEKTLEDKIMYDCNLFLQQLNNRKVEENFPPFAFSGILNAPNKLAGTFITFRIYLHKDKCMKCGKCIQNCPYNAFSISSNNYPEFLRENCKNCFRCIHHCPSKALSLSKKNTYKKLLKFK